MSDSSSQQSQPADVAAGVTRPASLPRRVVVAGGFDDLSAGDIRLLEHAASIGTVEVALFSDSVCEAIAGSPPRFPLDERRYTLEAIRFVSRVRVIPEATALADFATMFSDANVIVADGADANLRAFARDRGIELSVADRSMLQAFPLAPQRQGFASQPRVLGRPRVLVTGCYDYLHSGHIRFFEEASEIGQLVVVVGHDANIRLLKGAGKPLFSEHHRRYCVAAIRFVSVAVVSTGHGWLDAEPEIATFKPDIYLVNEDGDVPEKRDFCARMGLEYRVLQRLPKPGLPSRSSTSLRGF